MLSPKQIRNRQRSVDLRDAVRIRRVDQGPGGVLSGSRRRDRRAARL